jgi:hypothetical protein
MYNKMKFWGAAAIVLLSLFASGPVVFAGGGPGQPQSSGGLTSDTNASASKKENIDEYVLLLQEDLSQQSPQITGAMMHLTPEQSKKFWPIYDEYQSALIKLNNSRIHNLRNAGDALLTDERADQMIKEDLNLRKQRDELLAGSYERVKQSLGALTAARFLLVESQLHSIIDLQLDSQLPIGE